MTWIEVVDSAVKIGLGALISGVVAFLVGRQSHRHDLDKEYVRRRQESFEQLVAEFIDVQMSLMNMAGTVWAFLATVDAGFAESMSVEGEGGPTYQESGTELYKRTYVLEQQMVFFGVPKVGEAIARYRGTAFELIELFPDPGEVLQAGKHAVDLARFEALRNELVTLNDTVLRDLGEAYRGQ